MHGAVPVRGVDAFTAAALLIYRIRRRRLDPIAHPRPDREAHARTVRRISYRRRRALSCYCAPEGCSELPILIGAEHSETNSRRGANTPFTTTLTAVGRFIVNGRKGASPDSAIGADGMPEIKTKLPDDGGYRTRRVSAGACRTMPGRAMGCRARMEPHRGLLAALAALAAPVERASRGVLPVHRLNACVKALTSW
jgi:hypothetical protein